MSVSRKTTAKDFSIRASSVAAWILSCLLMTAAEHKLPQTKLPNRVADEEPISQLLAQQPLARPLADERIGKGKTHHLTVKTFTVENLKSVRDGDTVLLAAGTYDIHDKVLRALSGALGAHANYVTFRGAANGATIFDNNSHPAPRSLQAKRYAKGVTLDRIAFRNISVFFRDVTNSSIINCSFSHFNSSINSQHPDNNAICVGGGEGNSIENNLVRYDLNDLSKGPVPKGIKVGWCKNVLVRGNRVSGRLRGGIDSLNGTGFKIINNTINLEDKDGIQDHGVYAHDLSGYEISFNSISGFRERGDGGSLKLKNVDTVEVHNNDFKDSGIMGRVETGVANARFKNIWIHDNKLDGGNLHCWTPRVIQTAVRIEKNVLTKGHIYGHSPTEFSWDVPTAGNLPGGIYNNLALQGNEADKNITSSGNSTTLPAMLEANDDSLLTAKGKSVLIKDVLANDIHPNKKPLSLGKFCQPSNGIVTHKGKGVFIYTPYADFEGTDSFAYTINDGMGGFDLGRVRIEVGK